MKMRRIKKAVNRYRRSTTELSRFLRAWAVVRKQGRQAESDFWMSGVSNRAARAIAGPLSDAESQVHIPDGRAVPVRSGSAQRGRPKR